MPRPGCEQPIAAYAHLHVRPALRERAPTGSLRLTGPGLRRRPYDYAELSAAQISVNSGDTVYVGIICRSA